MRKNSIVRRQRLIEVVRDHHVIVIEAGGGFGKSTLGDQVREELGDIVVTTPLERTDADDGRLVARFCEELDASDLADLAIPLRNGGDGPRHAIRRFVNTVNDWQRPVTITFDDVHHLDGSGARLLDELARTLASHHRLIVIGRQVRGEAQFLVGDADVARVGATDLAASATEIGEIFLAAGAPIEDHETRAVMAGTDGWPAAVAMLAGLGDPGDRLRGDATHIIDHLFDAMVRQLEPEDREPFRQLARMPRLGSRLDAAVERPGLFDRTVRIGVPYRRLAPGWYELPGPVMDLAARQVAPEPERVIAVAATYIDCGQILAALQVLDAAGLVDDVARSIAEMEPTVARGVGVDHLLPIVDALPGTALDAHPRSLLVVARLFIANDLTAVRHRLLTDAKRRADTSALIREVDAELGRYPLWESDYATVRRLAARILDEAGDDEFATTATCLELLGRCDALEGGHDAALATLTRATNLYRRCGMTVEASAVLRVIAFEVELDRGRFEPAVAVLTDAVALLPAPTRARALTLSLRAEPLLMLGRFDEAAADAAEAAAIATSIGDENAHSQALHFRAAGPAWRGDREAALPLLADLARTLSGITTANTQLALTEASELANMVDQHDMAEALMARAQEFDGQNAPNTDYRRFTAAANEARSGDPTLALAELRATRDLPHMPLGECWRSELLEAYALFRLGEPSADVVAARAFESAASLGYPRLPVTREQTVALALIGLAERAGSGTAAQIAHEAHPWRVVLLGRFEVVQGGRAVELPAGKPTLLAKLVACNGGRVETGEALDHLWADRDRSSATKGLRNALSRLKSSAGDLVVRDGDALRLDEGAIVDVDVFVREASRAIEASRRSPVTAAGLARSALAHCGGELLPDDVYEPWTAGARSRVARLRLRVIDVVADAADRTGDATEAIRWLEAGIDVEPYDEFRYPRLARVLLDQGRQGAARTIVRQALAMVDELDLPPSAELARIAGLLGVPT